MYIGIGGDGGADVDADRSGVDELYLPDPVCFYGTDMFRQFSATEGCLKGRDQTLQDQGGLARAGYTGHDSQTPLRNIHLQRTDCMDRTGGEMDPSERKHFFRRCLRTFMNSGGTGQERSDL